MLGYVERLFGKIQKSVGRVFYRPDKDPGQILPK